jgi:tetratricopeptide (TPR) repeat protein
MFGENHADTLTSVNNLANLYRSEGKTAEATALFASVLDARRRVLGPMHPDTIGVIPFLGEVLLKQDKFAGAEALLREALHNYEKTAGTSWPQYWSQSLLGAALVGQSRYAEAEPLLVSGYQGLLQRRATIPFEDRPVSAQAGERIVQLYERWGKAEKAAEWREKLQGK